MEKTASDHSYYRWRALLTRAYNAWLEYETAYMQDHYHTWDAAYWKARGLTDDMWRAWRTYVREIEGREGNGDR